MLWIDSDNAFGAPSGDVDDAFAITALIGSRVPIAGLSACAGNTDRARAHASNLQLASILGWSGPVVKSPDLRDFPGRIVALGPLTNVAGARRASEVVVVGGNSTSRGRWPPVWPYEFNLTMDRDAAQQVFHSGLPLTIFPLNVARQMTIRIDDPMPEFLRECSRRWFAHLRRMRLTRDFPVYDLPAALYALGPGGLRMEWVTAEMRANASLRFGHGPRKVLLCTALDRNALWRRFLAICAELPMRS